MSTASRFAWSVISDEQFEELIYEVVASQRPSTITWRKGPADKGRDVEATFRHEDPFGTEQSLRVFVEAKHHANGVSPIDIAGALAWAAAQQPDSLVLAVSSHLTTAAREHTAAWGINNPRVRVQVWERKEIENRLLASENARYFAVRIGLLPSSALALLPGNPTEKQSRPKEHGLEMEYRFWLTDEEADQLTYAIGTLEELAEIVTRCGGITEHFELVCLGAPNWASFLRILQAQIRLAVTTRDYLIAKLEVVPDDTLNPILSRLEERVEAVRLIGDTSTHVD